MSKILNKKQNLMDLFDEIAGENVADLIVGQYALEKSGLNEDFFLTTEPKDWQEAFLKILEKAPIEKQQEKTQEFYDLPIEQQIEWAHKVLDPDAIKLCAEQNGISEEEQSGRIRAVIMAAQISANDGTVILGGC